MKFLLKAAIAALAALAATGALALSTTVEQQTVPFVSGGATDMLLQSHAVPGGTLYLSTLRESSANGPVLGVAQTFVPAASGGLTRYLQLSNAKSDLGVSMTAAAGTPSGTVGISRTAGTSMTLDGEATSGAAAKTDKALFELNLPDSYVAGANIAVKVNCNTSGTTITGASTTMTVAAYTEVNGAEAALSVSAAQQIPAAAADLTFTITGTSLTPGAHIALELVMLVTTSAGAGTGHINSVAIQG